MALRLRDSHTAAGLAQKITSMGRCARRLPMNMSQLEQVRQAVAATTADFGRLDILVHNAGLWLSHL